MSATAAAAVVALTSAGCADDPPPPPKRAPVVASMDRPARHRPRPAPAAKPKPVDRSADIAMELGIDVADLVWSPSHQLFAAKPAPEKVVVFGAGGDKRLEAETARRAPIAELRFMDDERIVYLVPPPPPPKHAAHHVKRRAPSKKAPPPPPPTTLYAIQPIQEGAAPVLCEGRRFAFSPKGDHLAWVAGDPGSEYVAADGTQVYPRTGVTSIQGQPAWSQDGASLAFIETGDAPRLVVLVEVRNPHGDNAWPLPPEASDPTLRVFWSGVGKLVVGTELTKPRFATSFTRDAGSGSGDAAGYEP
jgi:hypothetical protein